MITRNTSADVNVIALIGERGRELNDFIEKSLGEEGMRRSVIVVSTSDENALCRIRAAHTATAIAEYFRDLGCDVMLMMDSVTRFAEAQREIGLSIGEPPAQRGYTPSVFDTIPKLIERAGTSKKGSITAFYSVLVEGDDMEGPVSDTVRGRTDGHIILSRALASRGHYPPIDILASISRLANDVSGVETKRAVRKVRSLMAAYAESADLIEVGAYKTGTNPATDEAIAKHAEIEEFLIQGETEKSTCAETLGRLAQIAGIEIPDSEMQGR
jgi:flagellum-specific ATP synthase